MSYRTTKSKIKAESNKAKTFDSINATANIGYTAFFYHTFRNVLIISIPLVIISAIILSSLHISATDSASSTDTLSFNISSSCTLSSVVDSSHTAELINGTYTNSIGQTTITTLCNDGNGYSVYAVGYSNNEEGNNKLVNTESSNFSIISGTAESGNTSNWAMSLNHLVDDPSLTPPIITSDYDSIYGIVPNEWTKVASLPARATDMIKGSSFTTTYAVYTSSSQYAGTYNGQVKYMLVHPSYKPAVYFMQDVASWKEFLNLEESVQAVDQRDGKSYWVAKLKDGNIWMTQNLDFDIDATKTYTHNDTDLGWNPNSFDSNATWQPDTTNGKYNLPVNGTSVPGWSNQNNYPYSADPGDVYYYTSNSTSDDIKYTSLSNCTSAGHTEGECGHYHAGNYYNWTAAIASNNSANANNVTGEVAMSSICPKGWRLPNASQTDNEYNEFGRMFYEAGITAALANGNNSVNYKNGGFNELRSGPYYFVRSGGVGSNLDGPGVASRYWSGVISGNGSSYTLYFDSSQIAPSNSLSWGWGRSIRCLAR